MRIQHVKPILNVARREYTRKYVHPWRARGQKKNVGQIVVKSMTLAINMSSAAVGIVLWIRRNVGMIKSVKNDVKNVSHNLTVAAF